MAITIKHSMGANGKKYVFQPTDTVEHMCSTMSFFPTTVYLVEDGGTFKRIEIDRTSKGSVSLGSLLQNGSTYQTIPKSGL